MTAAVFARVSTGDQEPENVRAPESEKLTIDRGRAPQ